MNDDCIKYKLNVLYKIADLLNKEHISWAVGASLLLYLKGIVHEFNDIDIMVTESDVFRLKEILFSLGSLKSSKINSKYKTKYFFEFNIDGVEVDVMAGFVIVNGDKEYDCSFYENQVVETILIQDTKIPLQSVDLWKKYYKLMERKHKAEVIDSFLKENKI